MPSSAAPAGWTFRGCSLLLTGTSLPVPGAHVSVGACPTALQGQNRIRHPHSPPVETQAGPATLPSGQTWLGRSGAGPVQLEGAHAV